MTPCLSSLCSRGRRGAWKALALLSAVYWVDETLMLGVESTAGNAFFENKIRPALVDHCYPCHSAGAKKIQGNLKLDSRESFLKGGTDGVVVVPGQPDESRLIQAVRYTDKDLKMPPEKEGGKRLPETVVADLVEWVRLGAPYPETPEGRTPTRPRSWSFEPIRDPHPPAVKNTRWPSTSVDAFLLAKLEENGTSPAPSADKHTLIRRATYDLIGLPPTPEEIDAFQSDRSANAFDTVIERLLSSPHYGERWGRHWLDIVRYADTAGDTADYPVGLAWRYRNYVIDAFNADKPYDEFLREQIAGDILAEQGPRERYAERVIATGFLAISRRFGFDSENYHHLTLQDTLDTLGQSVLGLSLGCARCHDHKFDPISMKDYYALYGIFASSHYAFPGSEQKARLRVMAPLLPMAESQPRWREYDQKVAALADSLARQKQSVPSATFRSLHDSDGDFEIQKDAAGGSYGVIVPPWLSEGKVSVTLAAQSPFKNLYPLGKFGTSIASGAHDYRLAQTLYPRRTVETSRGLQVNLDFRFAPLDSSANGRHRFWIGARTGAPAVELFLAANALFARVESRLESLCELESGQWHNLQLTLDLLNRKVSGIITHGGTTARFSEKPFTPEWSGVIDHVQFDSHDRAGATLPALDIDNFGIQPDPIATATTTMPALPITPGHPRPEALLAELDTLIGLDGGFEWQTDGAPPERPWHPGPKSVVKVARTAQSPFRNLFPAGTRGLQMPNRGDYDGFGLTLAPAWSTHRSDRLHLAFDFRCGSESAGGDGSWRYYVGHGAGNAAAVELFFNGREFFANSGSSNQTTIPLHVGEWHQVQLVLDLRERRYVGTLATPAGSVAFEGSFSKAWDGMIDYTFIDSYGNRAGVRPALDTDNFIFRESSLAPLNASAMSESVTEFESRRTRVSELRQQLVALAGEASKQAKELTELLTDGPCDMAYGVVEGTVQNVHLQLRGEPDRPGEEVPRGFIQALGGGPLPPGVQGSGRLELANWLTRPDNPMTARVMVNRIWQQHFGRGLVGTPNDFGIRGMLPTHPDLLDHLATRFIQSGWSIKAMHRLIMLSSAYRVGSRGGLISDRMHKATSANTESLSAEYSTFTRRRLSAEEIRDSILAISGALERNPGQGHPFPSPVAASFTQHAPFIGAYDHNQRSVYLMTQRIKRHPFLALFDGPDPNASTADRRTTTVPTQALYFLNSSFVSEKADQCASRLQVSCADDGQRVELAWRLMTGRAPAEAERTEAAEFLNAYRRGLVAAGQSNVEFAALAAYLRSLFGSNEFLHVD